MPEIVGPVLGEDFGVEKVPFGMRFAENVRTLPGDLGLSGTATVECTFGFSCKADVDVDF